MPEIPLLIGDCGERTREGTFEGFKVRFDGEEVASYAESEDELVTHTLYKCVRGSSTAYRVYTADERDTELPYYALYPYEESTFRRTNRPPEYSFYYPEELIKQWPMFAADVDYLQVYDVN